VQSVDGLVDGRLAIIFRDLQYFAGLINATTSSNRRLRDTEFQSFTYSIQCQLQQLQSMLDDILGECLRLAMLAFLTTTFQIPGMEVQYPYLTNRFRECCSTVEAATPQLQDLTFWLLTVGRHLRLRRRRALAVRALAGGRSGLGVARGAATAAGDYVDRRDSRRAREVCI
jgi:hypothetical protein